MGTPVCRPELQRSVGDPGLSLHGPQVLCHPSDPAVGVPSSPALLVPNWAGGGFGGFGRARAAFPGARLSLPPAPAHPPLHRLCPEGEHPSCTPKQGRPCRIWPRGSGPSPCSAGWPHPPPPPRPHDLAAGGDHPKTLSTPLSPRMCRDPAAARGFLELPPRPPPQQLNGVWVPLAEG